MHFQAPSHAVDLQNKVSDGYCSQQWVHSDDEPCCTRVVTFIYCSLLFCLKTIPHAIFDCPIHLELLCRCHNDNVHPFSFHHYSLYFGFGIHFGFYGFFWISAPTLILEASEPKKENIYGRAACELWSKAPILLSVPLPRSQLRICRDFFPDGFT